MSNILNIKPLIRTFIVQNLDESFDDKVYWNGERYEVPQTPYCVLSIIAENKDKRTSTHNGALSNTNKRQIITTLYKTATITVCIYNDAIGGDYDTNEEFAYEQINLLEQLFEMKSTHEKFYPTFSIQNVSPIRPLPEVIDGGYEYRFEFDLTIGYNEVIAPTSSNIDIGKVVIADIEADNSEVGIDFEVSLADIVE